MGLFSKDIQTMDEITRYGSLIAWAKQLGYSDAAQLLRETLGEETRSSHRWRKTGSINAQQARLVEASTFALGLELISKKMSQSGAERDGPPWAPHTSK